MKLLDKTIVNGFYGIDRVETYKNFVKFNISLDTISEELKEIVSRIMISDYYDVDDSIYLSIIVPYRGTLDFSDAILHISEMSHALRKEYVEEIITAINNGEVISGRYGYKVEFGTVELINLLSAA